MIAAMAFYLFQLEFQKVDGLEEEIGVLNTKMVVAALLPFILSHRTGAAVREVNQKVEKVKKTAERVERDLNNFQANIVRRLEALDQNMEKRDQKTDLEITELKCRIATINLQNQQLADNMEEDKKARKDVEHIEQNVRNLLQRNGVLPTEVLMDYLKKAFQEFYRQNSPESDAVKKAVRDLCFGDALLGNSAETFKNAVLTVIEGLTPEEKMMVLC